MRLSVHELTLGKQACAMSLCAHATMMWKVRLSLNNDIKKVTQLALHETTWNNTDTASARASAGLAPGQAAKPSTGSSRGLAGAVCFLFIGLYAASDRMELHRSIGMIT